MVGQIKIQKSLTARIAFWINQRRMCEKNMVSINKYEASTNSVNTKHQPFRKLYLQCCLASILLNRHISPVPAERLHNSKVPAKNSSIHPILVLYQVRTVKALIQHVVRGDFRCTPMAPPCWRRSYKPLLFHAVPPSPNKRKD